MEEKLIEHFGNFKCEEGYLTQEDFDKRNRFWNKEQFRTWDKKELERDSIKMQKLLVALSKFSLSGIQEIRLSRPSGKRKYEMAIYSAHERDFNYAMATAPKTFFKKDVLYELIEQLESSSNFKCRKGDFLSLEDFEKRNRFWSKKQFRTWGKKELERDSIKMQELLVALSKFSFPEIQEIRKSESVLPFRGDTYKVAICLAHERDFDYAMSIAPKTFFKNGTSEPKRGQKEKQE